jgi:hypothetical protein
LHVRQSKGNGHGPQGEIPKNVDLDDLETVGEREVSVDYPESREKEQTGRVCPYCGGVFRGKQGVMIHLGQLAGRGDHPENPGENHDPENFVSVDVDENGEIVGTSGTSNPSTTPEEPDFQMRILEYILDLHKRGNEAEAERAEEMLLSDN